MTSIIKQLNISVFSSVDSGVDLTVLRSVARHISIIVASDVKSPVGDTVYSSIGNAVYSKLIEYDFSN